MDKDLLKIDVREPKAVNIDDVLVIQMVKCFSGIDISCVLSDDHFSLISSDSAIFLWNF